MTTARALACLLLLLLPAAVQAQEIWQTPLGRECTEEWIRDTTRRLNAYRGTRDFETNKPWRINEYGHFIARSISQAYEPDVWWSTFGGDKYHYMWGALYQSEAQRPDWGNANFNGAGVWGMRYFVRNCVARRGGIPPQPAPPSGGVVDRGGYACFGGATYPDAWRAEANCNAYGCLFGRMSRDQCLALGRARGAGEMIHGIPGRGRSNECWLQDSCADLRPHPDFTYFGLPGRAQAPPPPPVTGYASAGGYACFGGAVFPPSWRGQANCVGYGCQFGRMGLDRCLALGARLNARLVIHGNANGGRSNECWLQQSCADLRPSRDFTAYRR